MGSIKKRSWQCDSRNPGSTRITGKPRRGRKRRWRGRRRGMKNRKDIYGNRQIFPAFVWRHSGYFIFFYNLCNEVHSLCLTSARPCGLYRIFKTLSSSGETRRDAMEAQRAFIHVYPTFDLPARHNFCAEKRMGGQDWQSEVQRELRHHLPDAELWSWETGEASCDEDASVSLFAESEGSQIAVILDPWRDELFTALSGAGAEVNGEPMDCAAGDALQDVLVGTASSADTETSWQQLRGIYYLGPPRSRGVRILQNASLGHAWVAAGRLGSFFSINSSKAGALLVKEAGGAEGGGLSAANSSLRQQVAEVLQEADVLKFLSAEVKTTETLRRQKKIRHI
eukprot:s4908_g2.t1